MSFSITLRSRGVGNLPAPVPGCHSVCVLCLLLAPVPLLPPVFFPECPSPPREDSLNLTPEVRAFRAESLQRILGGDLCEWPFQSVHFRGIKALAAVWASAGYCSVFMSSCNYVHFHFLTKASLFIQNKLLGCVFWYVNFLGGRMLATFWTLKTVNLY